MKVLLYTITLRVLKTNSDIVLRVRANSAATQQHVTYAIQYPCHSHPTDSRNISMRDEGLQATSYSTIKLRG
jgi:hypothetical protein